MINTSKQYCDWINPEIVARELIKTWGEAGFIWLDGDGSQLGRYVTLAVDPIEEKCCQGLPSENNSSNPFDELRALQPGHWTGWISYEAAAWLEPTNSWKPDEISTLWVAKHDPVIKFDLESHQLWIEGCNKERILMFQKFLNELIAQSKIKAITGKQKKLIGIPINNWHWHTTKANYLKDIYYIKELIATGDIYQANLTTCCTTSLPQEISIINIFENLRQLCPAPFSGMIIGKGKASGEAVISSSPERFLYVSSNGEVEARPIKGTRPRHKDKIKDSQFATDLVCSAKDRAENIMIVDLLRNDLGKVCTPGSIRVPELTSLESYTHVHHLTSVIKGSLKSNKSWVDLLEASWPGGSITGAPKLRACERLYQLEPIARGPYCGSFFNIDWDGTFDSNILIRSIIVYGSMLRANAGCGIVADSDPNNEAEELLWKLMPLLKALEAIEI